MGNHITINEYPKKGDPVISAITVITHTHSTRTWKRTSQPELNFLFPQRHRSLSARGKGKTMRML